MRKFNNPSRWQQVPGKKRAHWGILTLDDLSKTDGQYSRLIAQFQARDQAAKELGDDKSRQYSEDFSI